MEGFHEHIGADGSLGEGFAGAIKESLGADYAETKYFDDVKDLAGLAKRGIDTRSKNTELTEQLKNAGPAKPGEGASEQEITDYRRGLQGELGAGKSADEYKFGRPENWPEGLGYDDEAAGKWAEFFHAEGVPIGTAKTIVDKVLGQAAEAYTEKMEGEKKAYDKAVEALQAKYQPDELKELGRQCCAFIDAKGTEETTVNGEVVKGMKGLAKDAGVREDPANFDKWLSIGFDPRKVIFYAGIGKDYMAGGERRGSGVGGDMDAQFVNAVNAGSPGMGVPA